MTDSWWMQGLALVLACSGSLGCSSSVSRGVSAYDKGCYPEAIEELMLAEREVGDMSPDERAHYALYRGLGHLALGDAEQAERWLGEAKALWDGDRSLLDADDRGKLLSAWQAMGHATGRWGADVLREQGF